MATAPSSTQGQARCRASGTTLRASQAVSACAGSSSRPVTGIDQDRAAAAKSRLTMDKQASTGTAICRVRGLLVSGMWAILQYGARNGQAVEASQFVREQPSKRGQQRLRFA